MCINTETCRSDFNINLQYLFVHMLVYNKHLLFNMHGMNIKVTPVTVPIHSLTSNLHPTSAK